MNSVVCVCWKKAFLCKSGDTYFRVSDLVLVICTHIVTNCSGTIASTMATTIIAEYLLNARVTLYPYAGPLHVNLCPAVVLTATRKKWAALSR